MKSIFKKTIFTNYTNISAENSNGFLLLLKLSPTKFNDSQMMLSNKCLTHFKLPFTKKILKSPLYLQTFKSLNTVFNNTLLPSEIIAVLYYKNLFFTNNFKNVQKYFDTINLFSLLIKCCYILSLTTFIKKKIS